MCALPSQPKQALNNRNRGIMDAHRWLQSNRTRFRGHVYGPIAVEVRAVRTCGSMQRERLQPRAGSRIIYGPVSLSSSRAHTHSF